MKKVILFIAVLFVLASCNSSTNKSEDFSSILEMHKNVKSEHQMMEDEHQMMEEEHKTFFLNYDQSDSALVALEIAHQQLIEQHEVIIRKHHEIIEKHEKMEEEIASGKLTKEEAEKYEKTLIADHEAMKQDHSKMREEHQLMMEEHERLKSKD
jgi:hypothetical protein